MSVLFEKKGTTISLTKIGSDRFRLSIQKPSAQSASEELSRAEVETVCRGLFEKSTREEKPDPAAEKRVEALVQALRAYAEEQHTTIESIDREIASTAILDKTTGKKRAPTRSEWLAEKIGKEDLEE